MDKLKAIKDWVMALDKKKKIDIAIRNWHVNERG